MIAGEDYEATAESEGSGAEQRDQIDGRLFYVAGISSGPLGLKLARPFKQKEKN